MQPKSPIAHHNPLLPKPIPFNPHGSPQPDRGNIATSWDSSAQNNAIGYCIANHRYRAVP